MGRETRFSRAGATSTLVELTWEHDHGLWISTWDNPTMEGPYTLNVAERADSNSLGWATEYFELQMRTSAPAANIIGVPSTTLYAMNSADDAEYEDTILATAFGLKLAPQAASIPASGISQVWLERDPASPLYGFQALSGTANVRLHSNVRVVPIRVIVLCDPDGIPPDGEDAFPCGTYRQFQAETLFDAVNVPDIQRSTDPHSNPLQVVAQWAHVQQESPLESYHRPVSSTPDRLFHDCGIQFSPDSLRGMRGLRRSRVRDHL